MSRKFCALARTLSLVRSQLRLIIGKSGTVSVGLEACGGSGHPLSGMVRGGTFYIVADVLSGDLSVGWPCNTLKSGILCRRKRTFIGS